MFKIGDNVIDKKTNERYKIYDINKLDKVFYYVKSENNYTTIKFEWEIKKYNCFKWIYEEVIKKWKKKKIY